MADEVKKEVKTVYYRSKVSGLTLFKKGDENVSIRFQPFFEKFQGDDVRVGYLACDDPEFNAVLAKDDYVEVITKADYDKATGDDARAASYATA